MNVTYTGYASDRLHTIEPLVTNQYKSYRQAHEAAEQLVKRKYGNGDTARRFSYSVSVSEV